MSRNIFRNALLSAVVIGSLSFVGNSAFADTTVTDFSNSEKSGLYDVIKSSTSPTTIILENDITATQTIDLKKYTRDITIDGDNGKYFLTSSKTMLGFDIEGDSHLTLQNISIKDFKNSTYGWGGLIYNAGQLTVKNAIFENNSGDSSLVGGGAIANNDGGIVDMSGTLSFKANSNVHGGAIYNAAKMTIDSSNTIFESNIATNDGGAIKNCVWSNSTRSSSGDLTLTGNYHFSKNKAKFGGAIYNEADMSVSNAGDETVSFTENSSNDHGGAIYNAGIMQIMNTGDGLISFTQNSSGGYGGAIFNKGTLSLYGNFDFIENVATNRGGAIYNEGAMSLEGAYTFSGNNAKTVGGAIDNNSGSLSIKGVQTAGINSITFDSNSVINSAMDSESGELKYYESKGGAIHIKGTENNIALLSVTGADFINNEATSHGGAIYIDDYASFNIEDSKFIGNKVGMYENSKPWGWGGAIGLASINTDNVSGYIKNSIFRNNYANNSGAAIPSGTTLSIVNSQFLGNHALTSGGAVSYNPKGALGNKAFNLVADGADTVFAGNWIGAYDSKRVADNSEGLYIGNAINKVSSTDSSNPWVDENDSNVYFNAGNSGKIIFNDIIDATGTSYDDNNEKGQGKRPKVNNPNIQLNKSGVYYAKAATDLADEIKILAPSNGTIIFNNMIKAANLVLHDGTLAFGQSNSYGGFLTPTKYFDDTAKITLKGGTLDLANGTIESGDTFNPASITVLGDSNLQLDLSLSGDLTPDESGNSVYKLNGLIDYINSTISGDGKLTINNIAFKEDDNTKNVALNDYKILQFANANNVANTILSDNLNTIITSNAGYSLELETTSTGKDSIKVSKIINAGGLPVAVSLGKFPELASSRTYIYNATADERIEKSGDKSWNKQYQVSLDGVTHPETASNRLKGEFLQINGNGKNIITADNVIGIALGKDTINEQEVEQKLTINDVKKEDGTGWNGFNSAIINDGGIVEINNSIFSSNNSSVEKNGEVVTKEANGGAIYNKNGTLTIKNTDFTDNTAASGNGGAIYNAINGVVSISATDANTVNFSGNRALNGNDIYNLGELNLTATDKSSIVFNGGISGDSNQFGKINIGDANSLGTVVFNGTVQHQDVTLNNGVLKFGLGAKSGRDDYFDNVNLTLNGGQLDMQNKQLDTLKVNNLTIGSNSPELLLDVNLGEQKSDSIEIAVDGSVNQNFGDKVYVGPINIIGDITDSTVVINFINKEISSAIEEVNKSIKYDGVAYSVDVDGNRIIISKVGAAGGFNYEVVNPSPASRTFTLGSKDGKDEIVTEWLGGNNKLAGLSFQIFGGSNGNSLIASNIAGIVVGTHDGNAQELYVTNVKSYQGFNSAIINNGGKVYIKGTTFENNKSTAVIDETGRYTKIGDGGVIYNNKGYVEVGGNTTFSSNTATNGKGGAIFNAAEQTIDLATETGKDITFTGNKASVGNDIYNEGIINIKGAGTVSVDGGIAGAANAVINNSDATLKLAGSNADYKGAFNQTSGKTEVTGSFFGGTSNITGGELVWNTSTDISSDANLIINGADLVVKSGVLSINSGSSIDGATSVTNDGNLVFNNNSAYTVNTIGGDGTLTVNGGSTLNFNNDSSLTGNQKVVGNGTSTGAYNPAIINISGTSDNILNANSILSAIDSANSKYTDLVLDNVTTSSNINLGVGQIARLFTKNDVTLHDGGELSLAEGDIYVENSGNLTIEGKVNTIDGAHFLNNAGATLTLQGNGQLTSKDSSSDLNSEISNSGTLNIKSNQSGFYGKLLNTGIVNADVSDYLNSGEKRISSGELNINSGSINYKNVSLGGDSQGASLIHRIDVKNGGTIDSDTLNFAGNSGDTASSATFVGDGVKADINLNANIQGANKNNLNIENANINLAGTTDFSGTTDYNFTNSDIKLNLDANGNTQDYIFDSLTGSGNSLSFNVKIIGDSVDGVKKIQTDTITVKSGSPIFDFGNIYITGEENGYHGIYNTDKNVLTGATFTPDSKTGTDKTVTGATTSWTYDIVAANDNQSIQMTIKNYSNNNTLYEMNKTGGTRFFQFTQGDDETYHIGKSFDVKTAEGTFYIKGDNKNAISGAILDDDGHEIARGSLFDIDGTKTTLNIDNVTILNAEKVGDGSVIANNSADANIILNNTDIIENTANNGGAIYSTAGNLTLNKTNFNENIANSNGGAVYNKGNLTILESVFRNNNSTLDGGAIYNDGTSANIGNTKFEFNHAGQNGGAIANVASSIINNIVGSTFEGNSADVNGGAIYNVGTVENITSDFKGNSAKEDGGAIYNAVDGVITKLSGTFESNTSIGNGGAIANAGTINIENAIFKGNASNGNGGAIYNSGTLTLTNVDVQEVVPGGKNDIYQEAGASMIFKTTGNIVNSVASAISGDGSITNEGKLLLSGDNSDFTGTFDQSVSDAITKVTGNFFGGISTINDGTLLWATDNSDLNGGALVVNNGKLIIGETEEQEAALELGVDSIIKDAATVIIQEKSTLYIDGGDVTLNNNDYWIGDIELSSGNLTLDNLEHGNGLLAATGGTLDVKNGKLFIQDQSVIKDTVKTVIGADSELLISNGGDVTLNGTTTGTVSGFDDSDAWSGKISLGDCGKLTVKDLTDNGIINAIGGELNIETGSLKVAEGSEIKSAVKTIIDQNSTLDIQGGTVSIDDNDDWKGTISLGAGDTKGTLNYATTNTAGTLKAESGALNLLDGSILNIQDPSQVANKVDVDIQKGATVNLNSGSIFNLDSRDKWNGLIHIDGGKLTTDKVDNSVAGGVLQQVGGSIELNNRSNILISGDSYIQGGDVSLDGQSILHLAQNVTMNADNLSMSGNSTLNTMNGSIESSNMTNLNVDFVNNFAIDIAPRDKVGDTYVINNIVGTNGGTLNISDFNFVGLAPIDRNIKLQVFDANSISDVDFTATDKKIFTPIGNYHLLSQGGGAYTASLADYNPQVFRGQVATMAAYNHQLLVDDMLTNHFILPNERLIDSAALANKSAIVDAVSPYQHTLEEGGMWTKSYVSFETLSMTNNLNVNNNVYGTLVGADLPMVHLKNGWKVIPTAFLGYNGGNQRFNNVDMYQNGGQGGLMGTFIKNNFIGSIAAYAGGYVNEMNVAGYTDQAGNWFAGTAAKAAYNIHATKNFIIQPTAFVAYNIFGKQNWGTDYGVMSMNSGLLNGVNVAPGLNLIYSKDTWSVYGTMQYMYNINDQVGGEAGNVNLASVKMKHGYVNYGVGFTKTWKDRLSSFFQINLRNGGRTGVGFQLGFNYFFDWGNLGKKQPKLLENTQQENIKPVKTVIKSLPKK